MLRWPVSGATGFRGTAQQSVCLVPHLRQQPAPSQRRRSLVRITAWPGAVKRVQDAAQLQHVCADEVAQLVAEATLPGSPPLVLNFTATWCGPCALVHKELAKMLALRKAGSVRVVCIDVDAECNKELATRLHITSLPTLIFVGKDATRRSICTMGHVSSRLVADVLDTKMHLCGADLEQRLRLS